MKTHLSYKLSVCILCALLLLTACAAPGDRCAGAHAAARPTHGGPRAYAAATAHRGA